MEGGVAWNLYAAFYIVCGFFAVFDVFFGEDTVTFYNGIMIIFVVIGTFGLLGYVSKRPIIIRKFWKLYSLLWVVFSFLSIREVVVYVPDAPNLITPIVLIIFAVFLTIPFGYAITKYAFFCNEIWLKRST